MKLSFLTVFTWLLIANVGLFEPVLAILYRKFRAPCNASTTCLPYGNWPGGLGNCHTDWMRSFRPSCICVIFEGCSQDADCCSGKCDLTKPNVFDASLGTCQASSIGDVCMVPPGCRLGHCDNITYTHTAMLGNNEFMGICVADSMPTKTTGFGTKCDHKTDCARMGSWIGGVENCLGGYCMCRTDEKCAHGHECCSNRCHKGRCGLGVAGDICLFDSCEPGLECVIPSYHPEVRGVLASHIGNCRAIDFPPVFFGERCEKTTFCGPYGKWPGGIGNCHEGRCYCKVAHRDINCNHDRECCSGHCLRSGTCEDGEAGDFCMQQGWEWEFAGCATPVTDDHDNLRGPPYNRPWRKYVCQVEPLYNRFMEKLINDITQATFPQRLKWGQCRVDIEKLSITFGMFCQMNQVCEPLGHWPGGLDNCWREKCDCRISEDCQEDRQCCSGDCTEGKCEPGGVGDVCLPNSCASGYYCQIPTYHGLVRTYNVVMDPVQETRGTCLELSPIGSPCDENTTCAAVGNWTGGLGNCLEGTCGCEPISCARDGVCCSGVCVEFKCAPGSAGDVCEQLGCASGYHCQYDHTYSQTLGQWRGTCVESAKFGSQCDKDVFCAPIGSWPGGHRNCIGGLCACVAEGECESNLHCCSGICANDTCKPGKGGDICSENSCGEQLVCGIPSRHVDIIGQLRDNRGTCEEVVPYGSPCGYLTICEPFGSWLGGEDNCHQNVCECHIWTPCRHDWQCCSRRCDEGKCRPGEVGHLCTKDSCGDNYFCVIPSRDETVAERFQSTWGSCEEAQEDEKLIC